MLKFLCGAIGVFAVNWLADLDLIEKILSIGGSLIAIVGGIGTVISKLSKKITVAITSDEEHKAKKEQINWGKWGVILTIIGMIIIFFGVSAESFAGCFNFSGGDDGGGTSSVVSYSDEHEGEYTDDEVLTHEESTTTEKSTTRSKRTTTTRAKPTTTTTTATKSSTTTTKLTTTTKPTTTTKQMTTTTKQTTTTTASWSGWVTSLPANVNSSKYYIEEKTQYRYRDKSIKTSTSSSLSGWTLYEIKTDYSSWSSWSDWSTTAISENDLCDVESENVAATYTTKYKYSGYRGVNSSGKYWYHYCLTCAKTYQSEYKWSSYSKTYSSKLSTDGSWSCGHSGSGTKYKTGGVYFYKMEEVKEQKTAAYTKYRYRTRTEESTYYFYQWSSWSSWSDTVHIGSDSREVDTRTVYKYKSK